MEKFYNAIREYWQANIEDFTRRLDFAFGRMYQNRCPLSYADYTLYSEMESLLEEFCEDQDLDFYDEDLDIEEIIWEA